MSLTPNPPLNPKITRFYVPANTYCLPGKAGGSPIGLVDPLLKSADDLRALDNGAPQRTWRIPHQRIENG